MAMRPLEPSELLAQCDLAGEARVVAVMRDPTRSGSLVKLHFSQILKGRVMPAQGEGSAIAVVAVPDPYRSCSEAPILGGPGDNPYRAGDLVMTHLIWDAEAGLYRTIRWNAVTVLSRKERGSEPSST